MNAVKKLKGELAGITQLPAFMGDCEVSEWIREPCSKECGGGHQTLRRQIISAPDELQGQLCPQLNRTQECNKHACPVDCKMSPYTDWTECSRECGGGHLERTRRVVRAPSGGGKCAGPT